MVYFQHVLTRFDGPESYVSGVSALALHGTATGIQLFSASGIQGGVLQRDASLNLTVAATQSYASLPAAAGGSIGAGRAVAGLCNLDLAGSTALISYGQIGGARGFWQDGPGGFGQGFDLGIGTDAVLGLASSPLAGGGDVIFVSTLQGLGVASYLRAANGAITPLQHLVGAGGVTGYDVLALTTAQTASGPILLTVAAQGNSLSAYRIDASGRALLCDHLSPADGLAINAPNLLQTLHFAGRDLVLLGAAGTGSVTVLDLTAAGHLQVLDQVNDDLTSRFQGISVLQAVSLAGRAFVLAGGADDGLTLMTLLPDGRLLALETIADSLTTALADLSALAVQGRIDAAGAGLDVFATGWSETSLSQFHISLGTLAPILMAQAAGGVLAGDLRSDMLIGGAGQDVLYGGAGADILCDGAGTDVLYGGAGADIFVLSPDGARDEIRDFNPAEDSLDVSALPGGAGGAAVQFIAMPGGIELRLGGEVLRLFSTDGQSFTPQDFSAANLAGLWHVAPVVLPDPGQRISGSGQADMLLGKDGADTLQGGQGADTLQGGGGADLLSGEMLEAGFDAAAAQIYRIYRATLDRAPDQAGHFDWTARLLSGNQSLSQIIAGFTGSAEFQARYGATSDAQFVTLLYNNVLHRAPDAGGFASWMQALAQGSLSRAEVVAGFSESREFCAATEAAALSYGRAGQQAGWSDDVFRLYHATLDRDPDLGGLQSWSLALAQGRSFLQVVAGFTGSTEFQARYGATSDAQFITLLYNNVLHRAPDAGGLASWTQALASGSLSREAVVQGFAQSREFIASSAAGFVQFMQAQPLDDHLLGGAGDNLLLGGVGADSFVFVQSDGGVQRVADLERWDQIELQGFGYGAAAQALGHLSQSGANVLFEDQGVQIWFADRQLSDFSADMFVI